jgi:hypothetical protein
LPTVERLLALWTRILGVLLVLLGIVLLIEPEVMLRWRERALRTPSVEVTTKRERVIVIPRVLAVVIIGVGIVVFVKARKSA